jgi:hypothetical protein
MRLRIAVSTALGAASGFLCWYLLHHFQQDSADFNWAFDAARDLLARQNPYSHTGPGAIPYPLPAALFGLLFAWLPRSVAGGAFFGVSSGLLAFGLTRHGYSRLLIFLAYPYWAAMITAQWTPLIMASAFLPWLLPVTMAKPQIGLPVTLTHLTRRGVVACLLVLIVSFAVMPAWLWHWIPQLRGYQHFFPILVLPGPLLLLAALRYRDNDAQLLLLAAIMPQRWFYDMLVLWLIPKTRRELVFTLGLSWVAGVWRWYHYPTSFNQVGRWAVLFIYLPMLAVVLARASKKKEAKTVMPKPD